MISYTVTTTTRPKSPIHGGFRGPTYPQSHRFPLATYAEIPHHYADSASSHPAPEKEKEKSEKCQNKPTFPTHKHTNIRTHKRTNTQAPHPTT
jgi:hypothetical protein